MRLESDDQHLSVLVTTTGTTTVTTTTTTTVTTTTTTTVTTTTTTTTVTTTTTTTGLFIMYSAQFNIGMTPTSQCTQWDTFRAQLTVQAYISLTVKGTFDPIGIVLTDADIIGNISTALRLSTAYGPVTNNGRSWAVGQCGSGWELTASGSVCICSTSSYTVRPCIGNQNFGGVNRTTCNSPTQTMTVIFDY